MNNLLNVSAAPHARNTASTASIMRDVAIALAPACIFGIWNFNRYGYGVNAFLLILICVAFCVATEYLYEKWMKKPITVGDYSAVVTGLILAVNLPATLPLWIAALGSIFAILVVKQLYGGLGQNFMNPALAARCFLLISFSGKMTQFPLDATSEATPLALVKTGGLEALQKANITVSDMFFGTITGTIGETSVVAVLLGAIYLLARKVISLEIPATYIATLAVFVLLFGGKGFDMNYLLAHLCGGGLMIGAFFMATDYVTSPITPLGKIVFGVILGLLTGIFRIFGGSAEGVSYAIIISNMLVPLIEKFTIPKAFGKEAQQ